MEFVKRSVYITILPPLQSPTTRNAQLRLIGSTSIGWLTPSGQENSR